MTRRNTFLFKFASKKCHVNMTFHLYAPQCPRLETIDIYITVDVPKRQDSAQKNPRKWREA